MSQLDDLETIDFIEILQNDEDIKTLAKNDPRQIIEEFFYIANKDGLRVPFVFNEAQDIYYKNKTARDDILKARKEGFSSLILALLTVAFLFGENVNCVCISHEEESTQRLFKKVEYYIENMTTHDGKRIEVKLKDKSRKNLVFSYSKKTKDHNGNIIKEKITNTFYLGTAGAKAFGRGDTIHYLHCSEIAFWENASRLMTGLLNAVPDNLQNTYIVKESTANGVGTQHHKEWLNEQENKSVFKPHFFGWYQDPTNAMSLDKYLEAMHSVFILNTEDILTAAKYRLNDDQLAWRNYKISSMQPDDSHTKEELFQQEYPIDWKEAFLASGKPIFKLEVLKWYEEACVIPPLKVGELVGWRPAIFIENENERLKIWEDPVHDHEYVIAADVAEVGDFCYATVINRTTFKQVAEWHGKMDEFEYAGMLYKLGYYYNIALIGVERNN